MPLVPNRVASCRWLPKQNRQPELPVETCLPCGLALVRLHTVPVVYRCCLRYDRNGGQRQNRTVDTGIFSPLLYRLSYLALFGRRRIKPPVLGVVKEEAAG